jgi:hypothetical protein
MLAEHDLFQKPVPTFRDHALNPGERQHHDGGEHHPAKVPAAGCDGVANRR